MYWLIICSPLIVINYNNTLFHISIAQTGWVNASISHVQTPQQSWYGD